MELKVFKIKDKKGKFSTGGYHPNWTKRGKSWGDLSAVKRHLRQHCKDSNYGTDENNQWFYKKGWWNNIPEDWIVVELSINGVKEYSAKELYPPTTGEKL